MIHCLHRVLVPLLLLFIPIAETIAGENADSLRRAAFTALQAKAESGDADALFRLSRVYEDGYADIPSDTLRADSLLIKAATLGNPSAQNYLGFKYYRGDRFPKDPHLALQWIQKAADAGDPKSFNNLGWLLMEGEGVEHDYKKASYWLSRAADAHLPVAMSQLADLYREGKGVEKDTLRAETLYLDAVKGGLPDAQFKLLSMNRDRYLLLSPVEAIALGHEMHSAGAVVPAVYLFGVAAEAGDADGYALLGDAYSRGEGVGYDYKLSLEYLWRGAIGGNPSAQFIIGELLEMFPDAWQELPEEIRPEGEKRNGKYWLEQAATQGVDNASEAARRLHP